jgi:hypothetical protein
MAHVYRPTFTKPIPEGAEIIIKKGQRFAKFKKDGKTITAPFSKDGKKIVLRSDLWHVKIKTDQGWKLITQKDIPGKKVAFTDKDVAKAKGEEWQRMVERGDAGLARVYKLRQTG